MKHVFVCCVILSVPLVFFSVVVTFWSYQKPPHDLLSGSVVGYIKLAGFLKYPFSLSPGVSAAYPHSLAKETGEMVQEEERWYKKTVESMLKDSCIAAVLQICCPESNHPCFKFFAHCSDIIFFQFSWDMSYFISGSNAVPSQMNSFIVAVIAGARLTIVRSTKSSYLLCATRSPLNGDLCKSDWNTIGIFLVRICEGGSRGQEQAGEQSFTPSP